jgi:hypothetical protein
MSQEIKLPESEYMQTGESYRNNITRGGVSIWIKKERKNGWVMKRYVVRCTEHAIESEGFRNVTLARKYVHKPWAFCQKCEKIWKKAIT